MDVPIRQEKVEGVLNGLEATGRLALEGALVLVAGRLRKSKLLSESSAFNDKGASKYVQNREIRLRHQIRRRR